MAPARRSSAEGQTRIDLAACYRLIDLFGWSDLINTRITARVPGAPEHFLINPYGMLYDEITASSLVKIDGEGNPVEPSEHPVNSGGFAIPGAIHQARPEVACVIHTHTIAGCAVSMQKAGLLPINQHALQVIGDVAYHDYEGTGRHPDERARFLADFGDKHVMVLRNHGLLSWGRSVAEAYLRLWTLQRACDVQVAAAQAGGEINRLSPKVIERMLGESGPGEARTYEDVFAAMVRLVDARDPSYRD